MAPGAPDDFEQELLADIAEADAFGEDELAAEWRFELQAYRAARATALAEGGTWDGTDPDGRREALRDRRTERP
jgi:hypothetical protein